MALPILGGIFAFLSGWFGRFLGSRLLLLATWKLLIWSFAITVFPVLLYNVVSDLTGEYMTAVSTIASDQEVAPFLASFGGLLGWLCIKAKIPEALSLIFSALSFRMAISMIPFMGRV